MAVSGSPPSPDSSSDGESAPFPPDWTGWWQVRRWDGETPSVPTYYDVSTESWDVIKAEASGLYVAPHPILEVHADTIRLKDEGADDEDAEAWRPEVRDNRLRVTALTGPHEGAVGLAHRIDDNPRDLASS